MVKKSSVPITTLSLALSVGLVISTIFPAIAKSQNTPNAQTSQLELNQSETLLAQASQKRRSRIRFRVPGVRGSGNLEGGAARGGCKPENKVKALFPNTNMGLTTATNPTFFFSIPETSVTEAEFTLSDPQNQDDTLYETNLKIPKAPAVVSFSIPKNANLPTLKAGKNYRWAFTLICDSSDRSADIVVTGIVRRVEASPSLVNQLKTAAPINRAALYAEAGLWNDTLETLAELRLQKPNDAELAADWTDVLTTVGLESVAKDPLMKLEPSSSTPQP